MGTTDDVTTRSPGILMIEGREYVLYQGFLERLRIADAKLLWLNTAKMWAFGVSAVLMAINAFRSDSTLWFAYGAFAAIVCASAISALIVNRDLVTIPDAVGERERAAGSSTLEIISLSQRGFSVRPPVLHVATVHPQMADFLLTEIPVGHTWSFRQRPRLPAALATPRARRQAWAANAGPLVALVGVVAIVVAIATR
jgi:hypothetical protein